MTMFLYNLFLIILLFLTSFMKCDAKYEGLLFSRDSTNEVYDIPNLKEVTSRTSDTLILSSPTAIACPAKSDNEEEFNNLHSFGKNCLFVRDTHEKNYSVDNNMDYEICDIPYKLSLIYDKTASAFSFGFEMYYEKSKHTGFLDSKQEDYTVITNLYLHTQIFPKTPTDTQKSNLLLLDDETELGFKWITAFQTKFNFEVNRLIQTSYSTSYTARQRRKCDNYDLGNGYFGDMDIHNLYNELYSEVNQKRMLEGVKLPTRISELGDENIEDTCESKHECFTKWLSVPSELFYYPAAKPTSCSNLLTVPIWKNTIGDVLRNLDIFLYVFSEAFGYPIGNVTILSGVQGILELPTSSEDDQSQKIITLGKNDMPVPNVIYKLVKFKTEVCNNTKPNQTENEESKNQSCKSTLRAMIVVVHNNPYFDPVTERICDDECVNWKWDEIQYRNTIEGRIKSKYIYCCSATDKKVREKLEIKYDFNETEKLNTVSIDGELSLRELPVYNYRTEQFEPSDFSKFVVDFYELLMEQEDDQSQPHES